MAVKVGKKKRDFSLFGAYFTLFRITCCHGNNRVHVLNSLVLSLCNCAFSFLCYANLTLHLHIHSQQVYLSRCQFTHLCSSSPVPPDSPSSLVVEYTGNSSISLSWSVGFDGYSNLPSVVISYEVDRYPQDGTRSQTFPMGTSATLTGLYPYSNYTIHVRLTNAVGLVSNPTNIT